MKKILSLLIILSTLLPFTVFAHSGRTNSSGCHKVKKTGAYHCHKKKR